MALLDCLLCGDVASATCLNRMGARYEYVYRERGRNRNSRMDKEMTAHLLELVLLGLLILAGFGSLAI